MDWSVVLGVGVAVALAASIAALVVATRRRRQDAYAYGSAMKVDTAVAEDLAGHTAWLGGSGAWRHSPYLRDDEDAGQCAMRCGEACMGGRDTQMSAHCARICASACGMSFA